MSALLKLPAASPQAATKRLHLYRSDGVRATISTLGGAAHGYVYEMTLDHIGIAVADAREWDRVPEGAAVEIEIAPRGMAPFWLLKGRITERTSLRSADVEVLKVDVKIEGQPTTLLTRRRMLGFHGYVCPDFFKPIAHCGDPIMFGESVHMQIHEVYPNGVIARTSLRNKTLFAGQTIAIDLMLPNAGLFPVECLVTHIETHEKSGFIAVDLTFVSPSSLLLAAMSEFVLSFQSGLSIEKLRQQGWFLDTITKAIRLGYPTNEADWQSVLELRLAAYHSVQKCMDKSDANDMEDRFDAFSRQIVARVGGRIVGAARGVFVGSDLSRSEHAALGIEIPEFIRRGGFVEASRFCTAPDFRGADVFIALIRHLGIVSVNSGIPYSLANCNPDLWEVYRKIGYRKLSGPFTAFGRDDCYLIYADVPAVLGYGANSGLVLWNQTFHPVSRYARGRGIGKWWHRFHPRVLLNDLLSGVIARLRRAQNFKRFKRKRRPKD